MASAVLTNADSQTNIDEKPLETFTLIWLNTNVNIEDTRNTEEKLRSIINHLKKFQDIKQCQQYVEQRTQKDRLVLIINGQMEQEIVPSIHQLRQVISIYVYCMDKERSEKWAWKYKKVKAVVVEIDELISQIQKDYRFQKKVEEPLSINIFTTGTAEGKSAISLNGQFVFSQILIDCLLRLKPIEIDKNELINLCKRHYEGNPIELSNLQEFEQTYSPNNALWWYTRESFFYKTLNAALRTQNIHVIFLFRTYISDIYHQLQYNRAEHPLRVYRSQLMSIDELGNLKQNIGQFISVNSFFSTSKNRETALFLLGDRTSLVDLERVLFEIDADPNVVANKPFADISSHSDFIDESEVLFMLGSIFHLQSIDHSDDELWIFRMTLCSDTEHALKKIFTHMKRQIGSGETNLRTLGYVLWDMSRLDLAERYFIRLLEQLLPNDPLHITLYEDLGKLASQSGNFDMSIEWCQKALTFREQRKLTINPNINQTNNSAGQIISYIHNKWKQNGITIVGRNEQNQFDELCQPYGIYVDDDHQYIYIADWWLHRIVEKKLNINICQVVAGGYGEGSQMHQLNYPTDVIVDKINDSLIICDRGNRRVVEWPRQNGINGRIIISDIDCYSIRMDNTGDLYVSDTQKNEVKRWRRGKIDGTIVAGGNGKGNQLNQLNSPTFIFVDCDYSVYISDRLNHRVMKWVKGAIEGIIVAGGNGDGYQLTQLSYPQGIFVDDLGNVYVADAHNQRIICWSKGSATGQIIVGGNGEGPQSNQFHSLRGLSFDQEDNLYAADCYNHRIQKFEMDFNEI